MAVVGVPHSRTGSGPAVLDGLAALAVVAAGLVLGGNLLVADLLRPLAVDVVLLTAVALSLGSGHRLARTRTRALEQEQLLVRGDHEARTALALEQERARIARELHDVVGHHICVVVAQARAGQRALDEDPRAAREALRAVEGTGRQALSEMRRLLDLLHPADESAVGSPARLDQLPALVAQLVGAGLPAVLEVRGTPRRLPAGLELDAYRIVQESLTNALKHGSRTGTSIVLTYGAQVLEVHVDDVGPTPCTVTGAERGLTGMRQRAALLGGQLDAGPRRDGGFAVTARLPVDLAA